MAFALAADVYAGIDLEEGRRPVTYEDTDRRWRYARRMATPAINAIMAAQRHWAHVSAEVPAAAEVSAAASFAIAADALVRLRANLRAIGFPIQEPPTCVDVEANIAALGAVLGSPPPPLLQLMWRTIGEVSVVDLEDYGHARFWAKQGVRGPNGVTDGVLLHGCDVGYVKWITMEMEDHVDEGGEREDFFLPLAPDSFHKDNISGGSPYGLGADSGWTTPLENFMWMGARPATAPDTAVDLLSYLRVSVLECAGFPGLFGAAAFEPFRLQLLEGLPVF